MADREPTKGLDWQKEQKERKKKEVPKIVNTAPLTSAQVVGWRQPYDTLMSPHMGQSNLNRTGICWRTFHDSGHL